MKEVLIPYVPYPINPATGLPTETKLKPLDRKSDLRYNNAVPCVDTGLQVLCEFFCFLQLRG